MLSPEQSESCVVAVATLLKLCLMALASKLNLFVSTLHCLSGFNKTPSSLLLLAVVRNRGSSSSWYCVADTTVDDQPDVFSCCCFSSTVTGAAQTRAIC
jgi:hypothetical protein